MNPPLVHLVRHPSKPTSKPPLLILLHGVGSHEGDLFSLEGAFPPEWVVVSARAPLSLRPGSYAWFPVQFTPQGPVADAEQAEKSRLLVVDFIDWAVREYATDSPVILGGFSQGAIMTASVALTEPEKVAAAVLMSGRILPEVLPQVASPERRAGPRFVVVHGTEDAVLPVHHGRASRDTLESLGVSLVYREFPVGHSVSDESLTFVLQTLDRWVGVSRTPGLV